MDANEYQQAAARTLIDEPDTTFTNEELAIMLAALELGAAVGKVLEYVKKGICHRHGYSANELGKLVVAVSGQAIGSMDYIYPDEETTIPNLVLTGNAQMLIWCALGMGGEAGEVMDIVQHSSRFLTHTLVSDLTKELGDNDWYNAAICTLIGVPMSDVMQANIDKLKKRFPEWWGSDASKARVDAL